MKTIAFVAAGLIPALALVRCGGRHADDSARPGTARPSALAQELVDAVELAIAAQSMPASLDPITPSKALQEKLDRYSKVEFKAHSERLQATFKDGVEITIPNDARFSCRMTGILTAELSLGPGVVGLTSKGDVFVEDGTRLVLNGAKYRFHESVWQASE